MAVIPNGSSDAKAIQADINSAIVGAQRAEIAAGVAVLRDTVHLGDGGVSRPFSTVRLVGAGINAYGDGATFSGTVLDSLKADRPALNVQGGRYTHISDLSIRGVNKGHIAGQVWFGDDATVDASDLSQWYGPDLKPTNPFTPYAAVVVDAYDGERPKNSYPDPGLPGGVPWGRASSSGITLEDLHLVGFEVAVGGSPGTADQNGDFISLWRVLLFANVYGVAINNSQARLVTLHYCQVALCHTLLTTRAFGLKQGGGGAIFNQLAVGGVVQLFDADTAYYLGNITFNGGWGEQVWRFGNTSTGESFREEAPATFNDVQIHFNQCGPKLGVPATYARGGDGGGVVLRGGRYRFPAVMMFDSPVTVDRANVVSTEILQRAQNGSTTLAERRYQNLTLGLLVVPSRIMAHAAGRINPTGGPWWPRLDIPWAFLDTPPYPGGPFAAGGRNKTIPWFASDVANADGVPLDYPRPTPQLSSVAKSSVVWSGLTLSTGIGTLGIPETAIEHQPGDVAIDGPTLTVWRIESSTPVYSGGNLIRCDSVVTPLNNYHDMGAGRVLRNPLHATTGNLYLLRSGVYLPSYPLYGDFTSGDPVVTNVHRGDGVCPALDGDIAVGDFLIGTSGVRYAPARCRVSVLNTGDQKITLDVPATRNGTCVPVGYFVRNDLV